MRKLLSTTIGVLLVLALACGGDGDERPRPTELATIPPGVAGRDLPLDFSITPLPADQHGRWVRITIEGVSVVTPTGSPWRAEIQVDPCSVDHGRRIVLQNDATGDRLKIDMAEKTVTAVYAGPPERVDWLIDRIQRSFSGEREIPPEVQAVLPAPVDSCDPAVVVPTLSPPPTPWPTVPPEPTWTPVHATEGTEVPSGPEPGEPE